MLLSGSAFVVEKTELVLIFVSLYWMIQPHTH